MRIKIIFIFFLYLGVMFTPPHTHATTGQTLQTQQTVGLFICREEAFDGYTLFAPIMSDTTYLIDNQGNLIHSWKSSGNPALSVYLLENGNLLRTGTTRNSSFTGGGGGGRLEELDWDGNVVWEYTYSSDTYLSHHDVQQLPNGNFLMIAWEKKSYNEAVAAGCKPSLLSGNELWSEHIIELKPQGASGAKIVWEWHIWDHLVQDYDATKDNYGVVSTHPQRLDINYSRPANSDWNHFNSIHYNSQWDQIVISCLGTSEIYIIDHSTTTAEAAGSTGGKYGKGGDFLYRWGNPKIYDSGTSNDRIFYSQHDASWIPSSYPGGNDILVFNNGKRRTEGNYSTIDEITPPVDSNGSYYFSSGNSYGPDTLSWQYIADTPTDFYADHISGAQRLPNGNTLICSGTDGTFFEVTTDGEIVWKYINPVTDVGITPQGETIPSGNSGQRNAVFRCDRYAPDYKGFEGKDLTSQGPLVEAPGSGGGGGGGEEAPFGQLDSPVDGTAVFGSVAVTGWALDDLSVESVKIYCARIDVEGGSDNYIGNATFVEGARTDVAALYSDYPNNTSAGWGYMLLTHFLPNGGNGTYRLYAVAEDANGNQTTLGTTTFTCDNAHATKPFGALDTPTQGGVASGTEFVVWGWALTPMPNRIPDDGSTINVWIDGVSVGHPTYNIYRSDIATKFPQYANSGGAVGYYILDTTQYDNGIHTIQWTVMDSAGNKDGVGSRYFTIQN